MNEIKDLLNTVCFSTLDLTWVDSDIKRLRYTMRQIEEQLSLLPPGSPHLEKAGNTYAIRVLTGHRGDCSRRQTYISLKNTMISGEEKYDSQKNGTTKSSSADDDNITAAKEFVSECSVTNAASDNSGDWSINTGNAAKTCGSIAITPEIVDAYVNKLYLSRLVPILKNELDALVTLQKTYQPERKFDVFFELPDEARKRIYPVVLRAREKGAEWESAKFPRSQYPFDDSKGILITKKGERVRSRIELFIANCLFDAGVPYRYECRYFLLNGSVIYPDFTIMHPRTGELYYLEYFGYMDDPAYQEKAYEKIRQFQLTKDAAHFICFMESSSVPLNTQAIMNTLNAYFCAESK